MLTIAACISYLPSKQPPSLKVIHSFVHSFVCLYGAQRSQKRAIGALELEKKEVVRLITWVLATKLKSSACEPSFQLLTHLSRPQIPFFWGGSFYFFYVYVCAHQCLSLLLCETEYGCVTHSSSSVSLPKAGPQSCALWIVCLLNSGSREWLFSFLA